MLPLFQYAVFSFLRLRDATAEIATISSGPCGARDSGMTPKDKVDAYASFLWLPSFEATRYRDPAPVAIVPVGVNYGCLMILASVVDPHRPGTVITYCLEVRSLLIPMGSGRYLRFLLRNRTSRWYRRICRCLEVLSLVSSLALFAAAFSFRGTKALRWAIEEKLLNGIVAIVSMRQFTRPSIPFFNFEVQHFERIRFKISVLSNSNANVSLLHGEFCRALLQTLKLLPTNRMQI